MKPVHDLLRGWLLGEEPLMEEPLIEEPLIEEPLIEEPLIEEPLIECVSAPFSPGPLSAYRLSCRLCVRS